MIAERLRTLRMEKGQSKRDLVAQLPLNYSTYANYESGFREPNSEVLTLLAVHFGVSIDYLLGFSENKRKADDVAILSESEHELVVKYRLLDFHGKEVVDVVLMKEYERHNFMNETARFDKFPAMDGRWVTHRVYRQSSCSKLSNYFLGDTELGFETMRFATTHVSEGADFCVRIENDSMEPKIMSGDIVFVKSVPRVQPESVGVFVYKNDTHCSRLRVEQKTRTLQLVPISKKSHAVKIINQDEFRTIGLVIGIAERVLGQ